MSKAHAVSLAALLAGAVLAVGGCDGGGNGVTPPAVEISGTWDVGSWYETWEFNAVAVITMDAEGNVSGTYDSDPVSGSLHGFSLTLTVSWSDPVYVNATVNANGDSATGNWHDSTDSGSWTATKR